MLTQDSARYVIQEIIKLFPDVETILEYDTPFQLLIAVMLSAQTTDIAVNKVTRKLFEDYPTALDLSKATPKEIEPYLKSIGLFRNKSKFIVECSQQIMADFDGIVPKGRKELESLSGVGRKTANVVMSIAFDIPAFAVDTHVSRVCKHHEIVPKNATVRQIEDYIVSILPAEDLTQAHQSIIYFGRNICHPRNPICHQYPQLYQNLEYMDDQNFYA